MLRKSIRSKFIHSFVAFSLFTTSFGGVFALPAFAESSEAAIAEETVKDNSTTNNILAGIAVIGLISVLSNRGDSSDSSSAPKTSTKPSDSTSNSTSSNGTISTSEEAQALSLLNKDRADNGLTALKSNAQLTKLAEDYAQDMIKRGYFSHYNPEGLSPFQRMNNAGITYKTAGENLAINTSVAAAEKAFMNSSGHRANILNSTYTDVGVGVVRSPGGSVYVVQEFISK